MGGDDEKIVMGWLIQQLAEMYRAVGPTSNAGPRLHDHDTINWETEGFFRWMGWRGEAEQAREIDWPPDMVRTERNARHMQAFKRLREENEELWKFLRSLRDELDRRCRER